MISTNYRRFLISMSFVAASFFLYLSMAWLRLIFVLGHPTVLEKLVPFPFVAFSLILCWQIASLIGRPGSAPAAKVRFLAVVGIVVLGAVLMLLLMWREQWVDLVRFS